MKATVTNPTATSPTPVFPQTLHRLRTHADAVAGAAGATPPPPKRENTFSKSRDTREDRGERQMKTGHNARTFPHGQQSSARKS
jgi:hypothetical protein